MLVTVLEIVAFMAAAAVLGVSLGWVLRGMFGNEQAEISDVRAQMRKLKKAQREQQAVKQEQAATAATVATTALQSEKAASVKQAEVSSEVIAAEKKPQAKRVTEKPATEKKPVEKKPAAKSEAKNKAGAKVAKKKNSPRKTVAEREADQALARQAFAAVAERVGQSDVQDNLTKIYGVGKRYAEMLNELGLSSYAQIGKLRKADVKTLSGALGILDARVDTEDWVGSAKMLAKEAKK